MNNSTLIIGPPKSGKTTFQAQLYMRLDERNGCIKLEQTPTNIEGLLEACDKISNGEPPEPTSANENVEVVIPVSHNGEEFDIVCIDYGGEQVSNITQLMEYDQQWQNRAKNNDRWILFVRLGELYHPYDLSHRGYTEIDSDKTNDSNLQKELSNQYHFIELLQALLHARGCSIKSPIQVPKLLIAITCWDELNTDEAPQNILTTKMPFFTHFVDTLWHQESYKIIGLSAQEFSLDTAEAQDRYQKEMPESFGYLVLEDNPEERDLTRLIEIALNL